MIADDPADPSRMLRYLRHRGVFLIHSRLRRGCGELRTGEKFTGVFTVFFVEQSWIVPFRDNNSNNTNITEFVTSVLKFNATIRNLTQRLGHDKLTSASIERIF